MKKIKKEKTEKKDKKQRKNKKKNKNKTKKNEKTLNKTANLIRKKEKKEQEQRKIREKTKKYKKTAIFAKSYKKRVDGIGKIIYTFLVLSRGGGIGRHARLRGVWGDPYEFDSRPRHHF